MAFMLIFAWICIILYQCFLGYGTAYRLTKEGGDNGVALFLWVFAMSLAAIVPGLGFYLWHKYRNIDVPEDELAKAAGVTPAKAKPSKRANAPLFGKSKRNKKQDVKNTITCPKCGREFDAIFKVCSGCGNRDLGRKNS